MKQFVTFLFILLFAYTAASKIIDHDKFIFQMRLAPFPVLHAAAPIISWLLPFMEMLIVAALLITKYQNNALWSSIALLMIFEIYITVMLLSGHHLPCTCGGIISKMSWKQHLIFNAAFIALGILALKNFSRKQVRPLPGSKDH